MNILLCTDNNYVMPTGVLIHSVGMHNHGPIHYYVLVDRLFSDVSRQILKNIVDKYNSSIEYYVIDDDVVRTLPFGHVNMPSHVSIATYYRLFITEILPMDVHKILYLDGDMIVRKSLKTLWNNDIDNRAVGVVHDMDEKSHVKRLGISEYSGYFNAGMLLINLDYWREHRCFDRFMQFINEHGDIIVFHDQDVLNYVLSNEVNWMPLTYNFQNGFILSENNKRYDRKYQQEIDACKKDPAIIHYTVHKKPWHIACFHPYRDLWRNYLSKTEWADYNFDEDRPEKMLHYIRNFLFRYKLWVPKYNRTEYETLPRLRF